MNVIKRENSLLNNAKYTRAVYDVQGRMTPASNTKFTCTYCCILLLVRVRATVQTVTVLNQIWIGIAIKLRPHHIIIKLRQSPEVRLIEKKTLAP